MLYHGRAAAAGAPALRQQRPTLEWRSIFLNRDHQPKDWGNGYFVALATILD